MMSSAMTWNSSSRTAEKSAPGGSGGINSVSERSISGARFKGRTATAFTTSPWFLPSQATTASDSATRSTRDPLEAKKLEMAASFAQSKWVDTRRAI